MLQADCTIVSQERITDEFQGIMRAPKPSIGIDILFKTKLLKEFFADLDAMYGIETIDGLES